MFFNLNTLEGIMIFYVNGVKHQAAIVTTVNNISLIKGEGFYGFFDIERGSVYTLCYYKQQSNWIEVLNTWSK